MSATEAGLDYRVRILKNAPLFAGATDEAIAELARLGRVVAVERGQMLAKRGLEGEYIFVVHSGVGAELHFELGEQKPILVKLHGGGSTAGLVCAVIRDARRVDPTGVPCPSRRAEALTNMTVLSLPATDYLRLCRRDPDLGAALAHALADQSDLIARIYARSTQNTLETRLAAFFNSVRELSATDDWNPVTNVGKLSQSAIATMLGVSREHVNRTIAMWERSGLIFQNKNGDFIIQNANRLAQLAMTPAERGAPEEADDWLSEIDAHIDRGLNQAALHLSLEASRRAPRDKRYHHRAVLATARLGAISEALNLIRKWGLDGELDDEARACLRPHLLRDLAFEQEPQRPDTALLRESADGYEAAFAAFNGFYSGVNAAAGFALIDQPGKSRALAERVCEIITHSYEEEEEEEDDYWRRTTLAECKLLQGDKAAAASLFEAASRAADATPGKKATTRKQLKRLSACVDMDEAWIDRVSPQSGVMFYSGPLARGIAEDKDLPADRVRGAVIDFLTATPVGWAYGALAAGADIIMAETLIEAGVALNVYLPLPPEEFLKYSVEVAGSGWRDRFIDCMHGASSIEWIRRAPTPCDSAYRLGAIKAMGQAIRHAAQLETEAIGFFAFPNGADATQSLSIANADLWKRNGLRAFEVCGDWPAGVNENDAQSSSPDDVLLHAIVVQGERGNSLANRLAAAGQWHVRDEVRELDLILFETVESALEQGAVLAQSAKASTACCWLDTGVFSRAALARSPDDAADRLITSACLPITEPGKVFASQSFTSAAALSPSHGVSFDYVGYMPTREKLMPCALYLARF